MNAFADSSALVKLYAEEPDCERVRALSALAISRLAAVEVPAALWRKHRDNVFGREVARTLCAGFEAELREAKVGGRFAVIEVLPAVVEAAAGLCAMHPLRGYDAVQLASAMAAREVDPEVDRFVCYDDALRRVASHEGFALEPPATP